MPPMSQILSFCKYRLTFVPLPITALTGPLRICSVPKEPRLWLIT